jgi:hypothetical protein
VYWRRHTWLYKKLSLQHFKTELEKTIHQIILENISIRQDSVKDYYNDDTNYVTLTITYKLIPYAYTFRYYGDKEYWDSSKISEIFIAYAHDENGNGGSAGNGGIKENDLSLKKKLLEPFEREFVDKIDKSLGMTHLQE